jgi:hypothetical protein
LVSGDALCREDSVGVSNEAEPAGWRHSRTLDSI